MPLDGPELFALIAWLEGTLKPLKMRNNRTILQSLMQTDSPTSTDEVQQEISISQILASITARRTAIIFAAFVLAIVLGGVCAVVVAFQPTFTQASIVARLNFTGVDKGLYPNGTTFSPSDVLDTPIVQAVYERNNLAKTTDFSKFKQSLSITAQNADVERLQREYTARLSERTLSAADRSRLEQEFDSKLQGLHNGQFTLSLSSNENLFARSDVLTSKIFEEILGEWARLADSRGIFNYNVELYTPNMIAAIQRNDGDYVVVYDQIRTMIEQLLTNLGKIQKLPHANLVRAGDGKLTLADLKVQLQDIVRFRMPELLGMVRSAGLSRNANRSIIYINEQIVNIDRDIEALTKQREIAGSALQSYMDNRSAASHSTASTNPNDFSPRGSQQTNNSQMSGNSIPQFGESFLDRIVEMTTKNSDIAFRQELAREEMKLGNLLVDAEKEKSVYTGMLKAISQLPGTDIARRTEMKGWVESSISEITAQLQSSVVLLQDFYTKVSAEDLKPARAYDIITPIRASRAGTISEPKKLAIGAFGFWVLSCLGFCALAALFPKKPATEATA